MKKYLLLFIAILISQLVFPQERLIEKQTNGTKSMQIDNVTSIFKSCDSIDIEARFSADIRQGIKPLTINFIDESLGEPESWLWEFGDGASSELQNPSHTYINSGSFTVSLKIQKDTCIYTLVKENYINVYDEEEQCDTLIFPLNGTYTYYTITGDGSGYVSGNNSYGDLAKANYFDDYPINTEIHSALFDFHLALNGSGGDPLIKFAVWDNTGTEGGPGSIIASVEVPLSDIVQTVNANHLVQVDFDQPIIINSPFYMGLLLPVTTGDTLALWTNTNGDTFPGIGWEQFFDQSWYTYLDSYSLNIANAIHPIVCEKEQDIETDLLLNNFSIYPNPSERFFHIDFPVNTNKKAEIHIYSLMGVLMDSKEINLANESQLIFDLGGYRKGLYFINIHIDNIKVTKKLSII